MMLFFFLVSSKYCADRITIEIRTLLGVKFIKTLQRQNSIFRRLLYFCRLFGNRSCCFASLNRYQDAFNDAERALSLQPSWAKGHFWRAVALEGLDVCQAIILLCFQINLFDG